jgi:hypothetical protein
VCVCVINILQVFASKAYGCQVSWHGCHNGTSADSVHKETGVMLHC